MEFNQNLPIYIQIMNIIKTKIVAGELNGGDKLPSVRELSKEMKVNPNTIQRVYQELEREAFVFTQRGMGTFVTKEQERIRQLKQSHAKKLVEDFFRGMRNLGFDEAEIKKIIIDWNEGEHS